MSSLLTKLTGHKDTTTTDNTHHNRDMHHTNTTGTNTGTGAPVGYNNLQHGTNTTTSSTTSQQTTTTGTNPYGVSGVMNSGSDYGTTGRTGAAYHTGTTGSSVSGARDDAITRSEEQLRVGNERMETGKAELNKYVTTEHVQQAVPVTRERAVIEREPITAANRDKAMAGPNISEAHYETTLKSDVVQAEKETVPIERIRLAKQTETTMQNVGADLRKEHVDFTHTKMANDNSLNNTNLNNNSNLGYNTTTPNKEY
jgi:stress response protein YsnF